MRVLLVGVGTVGEAIARISSSADWLETMVLADYDEARASALADALGGAPRFPSARVDARDAASVTELARAHRADLVMNAVDPQFVMPIFTGALEADAHYMDMACSLSKPHPDRPFELPGLKLGDEQFAMDDAWKSRGKLALVGMGMDPGLTDVFAAHAAKHAFDEVHEVHVRDGGDLEIPGYAFAPVFSIWTTIEECLNPPIVWENGDWHTTEPFSAPEAFPFPEGIGPVECVNVEHEEVLLVPRWIETRKATFKYALGDDFIDKLKTIHALGMDRTDRVSVKGVEVAPRDVLAAITPDPDQPRRQVPRSGGGRHLGDRYEGRGPRETFAYQMADAEEIWAQARPPGRRLADRLQPDDRHGAARHRRVVRRRRPGA